MEPGPDRGTVVWADLGTYDVVASQEFYRRVFGWDFEEFASPEGSYYAAQLDGAPVGGMMEFSEEEAQTAMPSMWTVFIGTDDIDADVTRVAELGGAVLRPPFEIPGGERIAVVSDPTGSTFAIATFGETAGGRMRWNRTGSMCWAECQTRDQDTAIDFYERLFGWKASRTDTYTVFDMNGQPVAGLMGMPPMVPDEVPSHWFLYVLVDELEAAGDAVTDAGGQILVAPSDIEDGRFAVVEDSAGAVFGLFQAMPD